MAAIIGNRNITLGVLGGTLITAACYGGGEVFGITPYDAATTAYLKATYPLHWQAIRQFGLDNPQLVPEVEANPRGWGLFIGEYQWVEYIQSDGNQYIDTGLIASNFYLGGMYAEYEHVRYVNSYPIIAGVNTDFWLNFGGLHGSDRQFYTRYEVGGTPKQINATEFGLSSLLNQKTVLIAKDKMFSVLINGIEFTWSYNNFMRNANYPLILFGYKGSFKCAAKLYKLGVYGNDGEEIAQYKPCYNKETQEIGVFDIINATFHTNAGTGTFTKGADIP